MSDLRVVVIGAGSFGRNHARAISQISGARLEGVLDLDLSRSASLAQEYAATSFRDLEEVFNFADCAIVATPTVTHEQVASALIQAGLDVLVEKPIASSSESGRRMAELARQHRRVLQVGHLERF